MTEMVTRLYPNASAVEDVVMYFSQVEATQICTPESVVKSQVLVSVGTFRGSTSAPRLYLSVQFRP